MAAVLELCDYSLRILVLAHTRVETNKVDECFHLTSCIL